MDERMRYKMEKSHDLELGTLLTVRFPERDVDEKALYTIQDDMPDFLIPFTCKRVDGMMECIYRMGGLLKLEHRFGTRTVQDYIRCWNLVLQPMIDCRDWFLNPFSFVLQISELYTDREEHYVKYLYIPAKQEVSDYESLKSMVKDISKQNSVFDSALENAVLRALMEDFSPKSFLQALSSYAPAGDSWEKGADGCRQMPKESGSSGIQETRPLPDGNIRIRFSDHPANGEAEASKPRKKGGGLFGWRKKKQVETSLMYGAAAEAAGRNYQTGGEKENAVQAADQMVVTEFLGDSDITTIGGGLKPCLEYIGHDPRMPKRIEVKFSEFGRFTIGRSNSSAGKGQADFEFAKDTIGVSRHHAVIENHNGSYVITDLQSTAGTYVDRQRIEPGEGHVLAKECQVSFGLGGADYLWRC